MREPIFQFSKFRKSTTEHKTTALQYSTVGQALTPIPESPSPPTLPATRAAHAGYYNGRGLAEGVSGGLSHALRPEELEGAAAARPVATHLASGASGASSRI